MPEFAEYELWLCDHECDQVLSLGRPELLSFAWERVLNGVAIYTLDLVAEHTAKDSFTKDYGAKLMRNWGAGWYEEYYGFHRNSDESWSEGDVDEHYWTSQGQSPERLLDQPLLLPIQDCDVWYMHGPADDVMKQAVYESLGMGAAAVRRLSNLVIQGNVGLGAWDCWEGRNPRLLDMLQELAGERGEADFAVVRAGSEFEFRTYAPYRGADRRRGTADPAGQTIFSRGLGNVRNLRRRIVTSQEVTAIYAGWKGAGAERTVLTAVSAAATETKYNRREEWMDLGDVTSEDVCAGLMAQELEGQGEYLEITFNPQQTAGCLYGRDWELGDLATLDIGADSYDIRITRVSGRISGDNEEEIEGEAELWART